MKVPMQWLKQYAELPLDAPALQDRMIMIGNGVEGLEEQGADVQHVVVGRVLTCVPHPDSDHLHITTVDVGAEEPLQIVCGAPNVEAGILVPVALVGASLPGGIHIKKGKLRGVESFGMLCSADELGVPTDLYPSVGEAGLLIFREEYPLGADVRPILGIDDTVMDFEVLANRPDCLSVWGLARECAVACGTSFRAPEIKVTEHGGDVHSEVSVRVEAEDLCPRYAARVIKNLRVRQSPMWLRKALHGAGMRSINNIVDITNYVMLETGHPMHAFDLGQIAGKEIVVRRAAEGESITTLDGNAHPLQAGQLVICDRERPVCVAGVMGGEESEITDATRSMMLECAVFDRSSVRLTSRALGLRTEASGRFEKGVSVNTVMDAMNRACQLIEELDAGDVVTGVIDLYPNPAKPQVITADCERIRRRAGVAIPSDKMEEILTALHFAVGRDGDRLEVVVPPFRQDVEGEADLCEEVLRVYGYEHIPATNLRGETTPGGKNARMRLKEQISQVLIANGFYEIMNYSFVSPKTVQKLNLAENDPRLNQLPIRNPLGEDTSVMRTTLVPDMLSTLARNMNRGNKFARLYEAAATFDNTVRTEENLPIERQQLVLGLYGADVDFYTARSTAEAVLAHLGIAVKPVVGSEPYLHPGRRATLLCEGKPVAEVGEIHPDVRKAFDMPQRAYVAVLDLEQVAALKQPMGTVVPVPRFPSVTRDLSLVMDESVQVGPLCDDLAAAGGSLLVACKFFDIYRSPLLGANKKSVALSFVFFASDHTLTEEEINNAVGKVMKAAEEKYGAVLRS